MKYFSEAKTAAERIMEVINRVPKIDSDNMAGEILENVSGEVEFDHVEFVYPSRPESVILNGMCLKVRLYFLFNSLIFFLTTRISISFHAP